MARLTNERLLAELRALVERFPATRMQKLDVGAPTFEVTLDIDGDTRHVRLTLPPGYPAVPPEAREVERPGGAVIVPAQAMHRFSDGAACLFTHGNDTQGWRHDRLAVEALARFMALVRRERDSGVQGRSWLFHDARQIFVPPGIAAVMRLPHGRGRLRLRSPASKRGDLFADAVSSEREEFPEFEVGLGALWKQVLPHEEWVPWVNVELGGRSWVEVLADRSRLDTLLRSSLSEGSHRAVAGEELLVLVRSQGPEREGIDVVHVRRPHADVRALYIRDVVVSGLRDRLFNRADGVIVQRAALREIRVVLVGLGSLGGAVALALARAGVGRFVLIDPDLLSVDNVCRHVGTLGLVGEPKVKAVEALILAVNPDAEVQTIARHLAWDLPALGAGRDLEMLLDGGGRSVIVTTCAVGSTERQLNAVAVARKVPVIYGAALGAAEHARVFRVVPGESACYECVLLAQAREPAKFPQFVDGRAARGAYLRPELPGMAIDVTQIAMLIARLTLQTIARTFGIDVGIPDEVGDHLLWSNRSGWGPCDRGLQVAICDAPRAENCPVCGERSGGVMTDDERRALDELLVELGGR